DLMTWTKKTTLPVIRQRRLCTCSETGNGRTAKMCADTNSDQDIRLDGAIFVARVLGSQFIRLALGIGISNLCVGFFERGNHLLGTLQYPDRLAAPLDSTHFTGRHPCQIDLDRSTSCLGAFRRLERGNKHAGGRQSGNASRRTSGDEQAATTRVNLLFVTHINSSSVVKMHRTKLPAALFLAKQLRIRSEEIIPCQFMSME